MTNLGLTLKPKPYLALIRSRGFLGRDDGRLRKSFLSLPGSFKDIHLPVARSHLGQPKEHLSCQTMGPLDLASTISVPHQFWNFLSQGSPAGRGLGGHQEAALV